MADKPTSTYAEKQEQRIEATHPHRPPVAWCEKCKKGASK